MTRLTLDWLHVVTLLGAVQGVFLTVALASKRRNRTANRLLAVLMFAFSVYLATTVYHAAGYMEAFPHFFGIAYPLPFLFGPAVWLYAVSAADRNRPLVWRDALHLVPFLATVIGGLPIYLMSGAEKIAFYEGLLRGDRPLIAVIADPLKLVSGVSYATITVVFLRRHRERVKESYSSTERVNLQWLLWLGEAAAAIWALAVGLQVLESTVGLRVGVGDDLVSLGIAILVYGIGYRGMRQPEVFRYETAEYAIPASLLTPEAPHPPSFAPPSALPSAPSSAPQFAASSAPSSAPSVAPSVAPSFASGRYDRSGLTEGQAERLKSALLTIMETERPWQNAELTLADLAGRLDTTPHKLSEVLNAQIGQTFYDFVNGYRVREVQRRIAAGEAKRVKMLALAMDAGFASKSTFNLVFKKHTSLTPSDYQQAAGVRTEG